MLLKPRSQLMCSPPTIPPQLVTWTDRVPSNLPLKPNLILHQISAYSCQIAVDLPTPLMTMLSVRLETFFAGWDDPTDSAQPCFAATATLPLDPLQKN